MRIDPQGPPWWIFFQIFFKNVLVYPQLTQKYVLWQSKLEKSILGRRELISLLQGALGRLFIALLLIGLQQLQTILRIVPILFTVGWAVLKLSKDPFQNRFLKFESASI